MAETLEQALQRLTVAAGKRRLRVMEVCGTHTHALARSGLKQRVQQQVELLSGPGCPVCVTDDGYLHAALDAAQRDFALVSFGDMLRVPSARGSLQEARARGARVETVYAPRDAVALAQREPETRFVFLAVGFDTTAPAIAAAVQQAPDNLYFLSGVKAVMPALQALFSGADKPAIDGLLLPGHVSAIIGADAYRAFAQAHRLPCAVAGFTPDGMAQALADVAERIAAQDFSVGNAYRAVVSDTGNTAAQRLLTEVFEPGDAHLRGLGTVPGGGLCLRGKWQARALAAVAPDLDPPAAAEPLPGCRCGDVLAGRCTPAQCPLFGKACTPAAPRGACMVSNEGSCAAAFAYGA